MDPAVITRVAPKIPFVCAGVKCTKPGCRSKDHRKCKMFKCILPAGYGPDNTRVFCKGCQPKADASKGEKKRPARYGQFNCIPTHCVNCGPPLGMRLLHVRNGFGQFELGNGTACVAEASFEVDGEKRCKEHRDGAAVKNLKLCTEPGCKKLKVQRGYCNSHAMLYKIAVSTCCVDCLKKPEFKTGSNGAEVGRLCMPCTEARIELCENFRWWRIGVYWYVNGDVVSAKYDPEGGTPLYCVKCKDLCGHPEMRDIANHRCSEPGCKTTAGFGIEWETPQHCVRHRTSDEVNATNLVRVEPGCKTKASNGTVQGQPKHCARHRQPGEKDVINKRCPNCTVMLQSQTKLYQPYCFRCFLVLNPTVEVSRQYLVKEEAFMEELTDSIPDNDPEQDDRWWFLAPPTR